MTQMTWGHLIYYIAQNFTEGMLMDWLHSEV